MVSCAPGACAPPLPAHVSVLARGVHIAARGAKQSFVRIDPWIVYTVLGCFLVSLLVNTHRMRCPPVSCDMPLWGVLIALSDDTGPLFGVIDQPFIGERFIGGFGASQYVGPHGSNPLATRATASLAQSMLYTTFPEVGSSRDRSGFKAVADQVQLVRYGMDCYAYALLALGHIDLVIEAGLNAYDIQAPIAVIKAAGGIVTNWHGQPAHDGGQVLAAANPACHAAALELLRPFADPV